MAAYEAAGETDEWYTPRYIFDAIGERFDLDVAAPSEGPRHVPTDQWLSDNALDLEWNGFVWMNPPFGHQRHKMMWLDKFFSIAIACGRSAMSGITNAESMDARALQNPTPNSGDIHVDRSHICCRSILGCIPILRSGAANALPLKGEFGSVGKWLIRCPVTAEIAGSNPVGPAIRCA